MAKGLIKVVKNHILNDSPDKLWIWENCQYATIMGSRAYGTERDDSDYDVYGFTIPPREYIFPHEYGYVVGLDQLPNFKQKLYPPKESKSNLFYDKIEIEYIIYGIIRYFEFLMGNNPNVIDSLFTRENCVLKCTKIGAMVRDNKKIFLHKLCWYKFKNYAMGQLKKAKSQRREGKRKEIVERHGYDLKFAMNIFRLLDEIEQLLRYQDMDLMRNKGELKRILEGMYTLEEIEKMANERVGHLEKLYHETELPDEPRKEDIKRLLFRCLEEHFGNMALVEKSHDMEKLKKELYGVLSKYS